MCRPWTFNYISQLDFCLSTFRNNRILCHSAADNFHMPLCPHKPRNDAYKGVSEYAFVLVFTCVPVYACVKIWLKESQWVDLPMAHAERKVFICKHKGDVNLCTVWKIIYFKKMLNVKNIFFVYIFVFITYCNDSIQIFAFICFTFNKY